MSIAAKSNTGMKCWLRMLEICVLFCFTQHFYALFRWAARLRPLSIH